MTGLSGGARIVDVGNSVVVKSFEPSARRSSAVAVLLVDGLVRGCTVLGNGNGNVNDRSVACSSVSDASCTGQSDAGKIYVIKLLPESLADTFLALTVLPSTSLDET